MNMKLRILMATFVLALVGMVGSVIAAKDTWFVLSEATLKPASPSVELKSKGGRWDKDVKQVKISVEGAEVTVSKLVLHWDNRPDDTVTTVGTLKPGGETAPANAPGLKGRLKSVTIHYTVAGGATNAKVKVWGYD